LTPVLTKCGGFSDASSQITAQSKSPRITGDPDVVHTLQSVHWFGAAFRPVTACQADSIGLPGIASTWLPPVAFHLPPKIAGGFIPLPWFRSLIPLIPLIPGRDYKNVDRLPRPTLNSPSAERNLFYGN
jgi:hypothetical protein